MIINLRALKACPFCGGKAKHYAQMGDHWLKCSTCHITGDSFNSEATAIAAWNRRAQPDGWVACSTQMPPDYTPVLVRNSLGRAFIATIDRVPPRGPVWILSSDDDRTVTQIFYPDHLWMPIPPFPPPPRTDGRKEGM